MFLALSGENLLLLQKIKSPALRRTLPVLLVEGRLIQERHIDINMLAIFRAK